MKRMVITGANGMLGSNLARLFRNDCHIAALHRDERCLVDADRDFSVDITDRVRVKELVEEYHPDIVVHCAGLANVDQCENSPELAFDVNVRGTENLLAGCDRNTRFIYISTDAVYGESDDHSESNRSLSQINQYARTKYLGEEAVRGSGDNHLVIRTNIFGWNVKPDRVCSAEWIYHSLRNGEELRLFTDYRFSPVHAILLGNTIQQLLEDDITGTVNVGSLDPCSKYEFGCQLATVFGFDRSLITPTSITDHSFAARRDQNLVLDIGFLKELSLPVPTVDQSLSSFRDDLITT